jgi:hypothetical protein
MALAVILQGLAKTENQPFVELNKGPIAPNSPDDGR